MGQRRRQRMCTRRKEGVGTGLGRCWGVAGQGEGNGRKTDATHPAHLVYHGTVQLHGLLDDGFRGVGFPPPLRAHGVLVVAPAKHALVGARQAAAGGGAGAGKKGVIDGVHVAVGRGLGRAGRGRA